MIGYIFETTNNKTGETYLGKKYSVSFDKKYLGDDEKLAVDIEKYGRPSFSVKMIMPYDSKEQLDAVYESMIAEQKPVKEETVEAEVVETPAPRKKRSKKSED